MEYAIVGFAPTNDPVLANAIAVSAPTVVTVQKDVTGPSMVSGFSAGSYPQAIQLTWDDRPVSDDADFGGWNVYRWTGTSAPTNDPSDANWAKLNTSPLLGETGYNDYTAVVGETAHYMVIAVDTNQNPSAPAFVSHRRSLDGEPPVPTGLVGRSNGTAGGLGKVLVSWDAVTPVQHLGHLRDALAGYDIERQDAAASGGWVRVRSAADAQGNTTTAEDAGLALQTGFVYRVRSVDGDGDYSPWATTTAATGNGVAPAAPTFDSSASTGFTSLTLGWHVGTGNGDPTILSAIRSGPQSGLGALRSVLSDAHRTGEQMYILPATVNVGVAEFKLGQPERVIEGLRSLEEHMSAAPANVVDTWVYLLTAAYAAVGSSREAIVVVERHLCPTAIRPAYFPWVPLDMQFWSD